MTDEVEQQGQLIIKLSDIPDEILIRDMNYEFHYKRIVQPDSNPSDLFNLHYREQTMEQWATCNGCLTEGFSIAKTGDVIQAIREGLSAQIIGERHYRSDTSVKSTFMFADYELELPGDGDADLIIFKLITNVDGDITVLSRAGMSFNIINGFSGNHALQLNYGFMKNISQQGSDQLITSNNPFLLDEYTHRLIHDQNMSVSFEEVSNVRDNVQSKIDRFKQIPVLEPFMEIFMKSFPKKFTKKFLALFEDLPSDYKNLYWASFIFGILVDAERKISNEIKLRSFVKQYVKDYTDSQVSEDS